MEMVINNTRLALLQGDITLQNVDVIVNVANSGLMGGGGVDGAIHRAGGTVILEECKKIIAQRGSLPAGQAVITSGGNLAAKYVIHTVGPIWHGGGCGEAEILASAYHESLKLAAVHGLKSISFPSISTGAYGYPLEKAAHVALGTIIRFLKEDRILERVNLVLFDRRSWEVYYRELESLQKH